MQASQLYRLTVAGPNGVTYESVLTAEDLPLLLHEFGLLEDLGAILALVDEIEEKGFASLPAARGDTITLALVTE